MVSGICLVEGEIFVGGHTDEENGKGGGIDPGKGRESERDKDVRDLYCASVQI